MKVVLDSNVIISGLMYPGSLLGKLLEACRENRFEWVSSEDLAQELERALQYPKVSKKIKWDAAQVEHFLAAMRFEATLIQIKGVAAIVPGDRDDDKVLATLIASQADYLVTGAKVLLDLATKHPILSPADFWERFGGV